MVLSEMPVSSASFRYVIFPAVVLRHPALLSQGVHSRTEPQADVLEEVDRSGRVQSELPACVDGLPVLSQHDVSVLVLLLRNPPLPR